MKNKRVNCSKAFFFQILNAFDNFAFSISQKFTRL